MHKRVIESFNQLLKVVYGNYFYVMNPNKDVLFVELSTWPRNTAKACAQSRN
jgi:hypothetical protein